MKGLHPGAGHLFAAAAILALLAPSLAVAQAPAGATAVCGDGSYSTAATKRGACSGHGGIKSWLADQKAAPKAKATPRAAPATAPTPATAKPAGATGVCADGSYTSAKSARGACSGHGGVKQWLIAPTAAPMAPMAPKGPPPTATPPKAGPTAPANATGICNDGTYTTARSARGACSGHGGVKSWMVTPAGPQTAPPKATPNVAPSPRAAPQATKAHPNAPVDAANATALCNDGTYSASQHRGGTCSRHGGVKQWLKELPQQ